MNRTFWLNPCDNVGLLVALMRLFEGTSRIALEGRLSVRDFATIPGVATGPIDPFALEYGGPSHMVVLPLTSESMPEIERVLFANDRIVNDIGAIQIETGGEVEFMAGDHFHHECISVGAGVPETLLKGLVRQGILRGYSPAQGH